MLHSLKVHCAYHYVAIYKEPIFCSQHAYGLSHTKQRECAYHDIYHMTNSCVGCVPASHMHCLYFQWSSFPNGCHVHDNYSFAQMFSQLHKMLLFPYAGTMHTRACTCTHAYTHTHIRAHTHTHARTHGSCIPVTPLNP